jgi:glycosyltransferase involved in cell wall biosynthesis
MAEKPTFKVCMISCLHGLYDDRIYWKEALSLQKNKYQVTHLAVGNEDRDFISEHGIKLMQIARKRYFKNPYLDIIFRKITFRKNIYKQLLAKATHLEADVYHFHDLQLNRIGPKLKKLRHNPKVIYDVHEPYPEIIRYLHSGGIIKNIYHKIYADYIDNWQGKRALKYDLIITTEENVALYFKQIISELKVKIIYNYSTFSVNENNDNKKEFDVIYAGGISSWRGIFEILEVAILAKSRKIDLKILFIGKVKEPGLKKKILNIIESNNLKSHFFLFDAIPYEQISEFYNKSKIGLCIFKDNPVYRIIMPIKIFEYMAMGLPYICNNFGHAAKLAKLENCGVTIDNVTSEDLLNEIILLKNDNHLLRKKSLNGINAYKTKYRWEYMENELLSIYHQLLIF